MIATRRALATIAIAAGLLSSTAIPAFAGAFGLREQSAEGQGMSFAGMAAGGGGLSSMFWNPATITDSPGIQGSFVGTGIYPAGSINPSPTSPTAAFGGSTGVILSGFVPAGYGSYQFNDHLWIGIATNAPFGLESKPGYNWAAQVYGRSARVFSFDVNPTVGYKINDWISVGVGLQVEYFKARLTQALGILPNAPGALLEGDDTGVGFTAGATFKPTAWTEIGVGYRSTVHETVTGTLTTPFGTSPAKLNFNLPEKVSVGVRQKVTDQWTVLGEFEWDNWSRVNVLPVTSNGSIVTTLPFKYKDGYFASLGVEYAWNEMLSLRTGVAYERSPIDLGNREVLLPDANRIWASIGATYHYNKKLSFDVGYSHGFLAHGNIAVVPGHPQFASAGLPFVAEVKNAHFDIVSAGLTYRWDDTSQPIPANQPLVRKY